MIETNETKVDDDNTILKRFRITYAASIKGMTEFNTMTIVPVDSEDATQGFFVIIARVYRDMVGTQIVEEYLVCNDRMNPRAFKSLNVIYNYAKALKMNSFDAYTFSVNLDAFNDSN
jgi:hypothetical protein